MACAFPQLLRFQRIQEHPKNFPGSAAAINTEVLTKIRHKIQRERQDDVETNPHIIFNQDQKEKMHTSIVTKSSNFSFPQETRTEHENCNKSSIPRKLQSPNLHFTVQCNSSRKRKFSPAKSPREKSKKSTVAFLSKCRCQSSS